MEYSRLIHDYLDGELNPLLEDRLFTEMAVNQDLRAEFSNQVRLGSLTRRDLDAIHIPSESTEAIFTSLGFSIPSSSIPNVGIRYYWSWLKKHSLGTVSALLLLMLMISASWQLNNPMNPTSAHSQSGLSTDKVLISESKNNDLNRGLNQNNRIEPTNRKVNSNNFAMPSSVESNHKSNSKLFRDSDKPSAIFESDESPKQDESLNQNIAFANSNLSNNYFNANSTGIYPIGESIPKFNSFANDNRQMNLQNGTQITPFDFSGLDLDVSWTKSKYQYDKSLKVPSDEHSFLFGNDVTVLYKFNDEHALGIAIGEEEFYQEFSYHTGEQIATYKQIPNYFWGGIAYRYTPTGLKLNESIQPYSKIIAAGAKGGFIAKVEMGFTMRITPSISVFAGGEYGAMIYNIRKEIYNSDKFKLLYGINMSL